MSINFTSKSKYFHIFELIIEYLYEPAIVTLYKVRYYNKQQKKQTVGI